MPLDTDFPASLWTLYDRTGIRPEWALTVMHLESRLNPAISNPNSGCVGLFQWCSAPAGFGSWSASQQVLQGAIPFWGDLVSRYGAITSGVRLEQGNYLPATLATATGPNDTIADASSGNVYSWNIALDPGRTGRITQNTIARALAPHAQAVQNLIAQTYSLRPGETPTDPIWGTSKPTSRVRTALFVGTAAVAAAGLVALAFEEVRSPGLLLPWRAQRA